MNKKVKLLIITQKVDINDPILGFFHRWIEEFSKHAEQVMVVCLKEGKHNLPSNVRVFSLGKEKGVSRLKYLINFYKYIWQERKNYDAVFVHMNPEYVVLGGVFWRMIGKKVTLWYNHTHGSFPAKLALLMVSKVFYTSPHAFMANRPKALRMPAGIDTSFFKRMDGVRNPHSILFLGRLAPVKQVENFIKALLLLDSREVVFTAHIVGDALPKDKEYEQLIRELATSLIEKNIFKFSSGVTHLKTLELYNSYELYVNLTQTGSYDKTVLEAMACEQPVIVSNLSFEGVLPDYALVPEKSPDKLADAINHIFNFTNAEKKTQVEANRQYVVENHNLERLIQNLTSYLE